MTTTAHERALRNAAMKYLERDYPAQPDVTYLERACKAYLQALLDDAETAAEVAKSIAKAEYELENVCSKDAPPYDPENQGWETYTNTAQAAIATLKRMGGV